MVARIVKPKTRRGKRFLDKREPKVIENDKMTLIVRGGKTTDVVTSALADIYALKKPLAQQMKKKNPFHLFEDDTPMERFSQKFDASLFVFGSNSKKHPNCLAFGRMYDYHVLDMVELRIENYIPAKDFAAPKVVLGTKPCLVLQGTSFESDETMKRLGNLMIDWFRGPVVESIQLQGLELVISLTALDQKLLFRVYRTSLKKAASTVPRVELIETGPRIDFIVQRTKLADESLFRTALKMPRQITAKPRKNFSEDVFGTQLGRIHVGKQNLGSFQTRKVKALRKDNSSRTAQTDTNSII